MGNKSRRQPKAQARSVKPPPRSPNWIFTGSGRGYQFINMDSVRDARAEMTSAGILLKLSNSYAALEVTGRPAEDMIAHLVMVGTDVTGAAEVLRDRFVQNIRENLETLYVLEEEHLEAFHRGEISTVAEDLRGDAGDVGGMCENCNAGPGCPEFRRGRDGTCEGYIEKYRSEDFASGGESCVICKCTESTPCEGNDGNPCHWTRPDALCSTCAEALEVLEGLERGLIGEELLTPAERHVLELLEAAGYDPGVAANLRREFNLVDQAHDLDRSIRRTVVRKEAAAYELELGDKAAEIGGSSADRSSCPHGAAVADECKLFPRCHVCVRPKAKTFHDPATDCAHDEKDDCDDCNDCGDVLEEPPAPDGVISPLGPPLGVSCNNCRKVDKPSCTWSNPGPAPCPAFECKAAVTEDADRVFIRRTEGDLIEERPATRHELEHAMLACTVYQGLERTRSLPVQPATPFTCRIGEEMDAAWCKVCPYYSEEGL